MASKNEIVAALVDLGLTRSEAEVYTEMLLMGGEAPLSGYKVAKAMGRDPANVTKLLAALEQRGAVRMEQEKPRLFTAVPPEVFTEHLVQQAQDRRKQALSLLAKIGTTVAADGVYSLRSRGQVHEHCRKLLSECRRLVLIDGDPDWLETMREDLQTAARQRRIAVLVRACRPCAIDGAGVFVAPNGSTRIAMAPGGWLRMVVDGEQFVSAYCRSGPDQTVLQAFWSRSPFLAFEQHHDLGLAIVQTAWQDLRAGGAEVAVADARTAELAALVTHQIDWPSRWRQLGLPPLTVATSVAASTAEASNLAVPPYAVQPGPRAADSGADTTAARKGESVPASATTDPAVGAVDAETVPRSATSDQRADTGLEFVFRKLPADGHEKTGRKKEHRPKSDD